MQPQNRIFITTKEVHSFKDSSLKLFWTPGLSRDYYKKRSIIDSYSNGITEGMNNLIKQVIHSACGYRKFKHLKARILLIKGLIKINT